MKKKTTMKTTMRGAPQGRCVRLLRGALLLGCLLTGMVGCDRYEEPLPRRDRLNFPIGLALHPGGEYLYVVNSNFDSRYSPAQGGTVSVVDTQTFAILEQGSPFIASFGGAIALNDEASKAYVTTRSGDNLVVLDVMEDGKRLGCEDSSDPLDTTACSLHRIPDTVGSPELSADPFGLEVVTVERGSGAERVSVDVVALSYLSSQLVSAVSLPNQDRSAASLTSAPIINGGNQIARRPGTLEMYVAGRNTNQVAVFLPYINADGEAEAIFSRRTLTLNTLANSVDARGIAFDARGEHLYVSTRRPDALHVFRVTASDPDEGTGVSHELEHTILLDEQPSDLEVFEVPGTQDTLVIVPCYDAKKIQIVDATRGVITSVIELDETPYAFVSEQGIAGRCGAPGETCRGYVSLFTDSPELSTSCDENGVGCGSVAVIDLDPASDRYLQVIAKVR